MTALSAKGGNVVYDGHSHYGIGPGFSDKISHLSDFLKISEPVIQVNWDLLKECPNLTIASSDYADDPSTPASYDPLFADLPIITGNIGLPVEPIRIRRESPIDGVTMSNSVFVKGVQPSLDHNYDPDAGDTGSDGASIIVKRGVSDVPSSSQNWSKLFLNCCTSGIYYYNTMRHGTLFFTRDTCQSVLTTKEYINAILNGMNDGQICKAIAAAEFAQNPVINVEDYFVFSQ